MTLQQLRYFVATVDGGFNISRAASAVNTSQPGISKQIKLLEHEVGTPLLVRGASRIVGLTDSGERVYEAARRVLRETDGLAQLSHDILQLQSGCLTIASLHTYALALLPQAAAQLRQRYPGVSFELQQASPAHIVELVRAGEADVGVSMEIPPPGSGVLGFSFLKVPRVLFTPKRHPLLKLKKVTLQDVVRYPFVAQHDLTAGGWAVSRVLKTHGLSVETSVLAGDASVMKAYIEQGLGVAVMSSLLYDPVRDSGLAIIDLSHIFEPSTVSLLIDPYRFQRGYVYDFIRLLAPEWDRARVADAVRRFVLDNKPAPAPSPVPAAGRR